MLPANFILNAPHFGRGISQAWRGVLLPWAAGGRSLQPGKSPGRRIALRGTGGAGAIPTAFAPSAEKGSQSQSDWGMSLNITKFITLGRLLIELSIENNGGIKSQNDAS